MMICRRRCQVRAGLDAARHIECCMKKNAEIDKKRITFKKFYFQMKIIVKNFPLKV